MAQNGFPVTIVSDSAPVVEELTRCYQPIPSNDQSSLKYIPGLTTGQVSIPNQVELKRIRSSMRVWMHFHRHSVHHNSPPFESSEIKFGSFADLMTFNYHHVTRNIQIQFDETRTEIHIVRDGYCLRLAEDCLDGYFVIDSSGRMFLPLKKAVRCFQKTNRGVPPRLYKFTDKVTAENLGDTTAIGITEPFNFNILKEFLIEKLKLTCFYAFSPMSIILIDDNQNIQLPADVDFLSHYGWQMILSLGYHIKDRLDRNFIRYVGRKARESHRDRYPEHRFYRKAIAIYHLAKNNRFFNIVEQYRSTHPRCLPPLQSSYDYVPRIYLTPYGIYPRTLKPIRGNRVIRQHDRFGPPVEHFLRVMLRDCDLSSIQSEAIEAWQLQLESILLENGLTIGPHRFEFLLFSNSQLRDRSLCFYRRFGSMTGEGIRQWLGQFNHEKSVGTRIARMAQCFTSTINGILLQKDQLQLIPDRFDSQNRCFTDGCGKISTSLLRKLFAKTHAGQFEMHRLPSVIQIRCSGIKGVLAHAPDLVGDVIHYRKSQMKFDCDHLELELIKYSQPNGITLNQQVITLLEFLGVDTSTFIQYQNEFRKRLSMALISSTAAAALLDKNIRHYSWKKMDQSGFVVSEEPFMRSLLMTLITDRLQRLRDKSHIPLSMDDGRMLLGVVDETNSLNEGEVFIQISKETEEGEELEIIKNRKVLVTRMPCHHPGDIRALRAVDRPRLRHLTNCIVFPAKGNRPHPTEMSGGDLDGDEYWACWNPLFVDQVKMKRPGDYTAPEKPKVEGEISMAMMVKFIIDILSKMGHVGILSRRHLAICALDSPENPKALRLTQFINDSLDFPKTGVSSMTTDEFRKSNVHEYPDFMQNKTKKLFKCDKTLGRLFHQMEKTVAIHLPAKQSIKPIPIDSDLIVPGWEQFLEAGKREYQDYCHKMDVILDTYELVSEMELITGCHSTAPEETKNNDDLETAGQEFRSLRNETKRIFKNSITINDQERKASAYYVVAYLTYNQSITASNNQRQGYLSFPWTVHELLCQIKAKKLEASAPEDFPAHRCMEKIGKILINANPNVPKTIRFFFHLIETWMTNVSQFNRANLFDIMSFCQTDEKFIESTQSDEPATSRIGKQFLMLIDFLSMANRNRPSLQIIANEFLLKLHCIAVNVDI